jgi:DNA processing protein
VPLGPERADDLGAWLRLSLTPGVGPVGARALLEAFGAADAVFGAAGGRLEAVVGPRLAAALSARDPERERRIARALDWARDDPHHLVTIADPDYPPQLLQIADAPPLLYAVGVRSTLTRPSVAIVGTRNPTAAGLANARAFARALSQAGWTVASGMALGIDGAAHEGALAGGAGTIAVLGTGADVVYPVRHRGLAARIAADGVVLSELPLGTGPAPGQFPRRNRLIAGLSHGVLVVEAALQSGSLITARQAGEFGREVFAIPGSIHSPLARGGHALIRQGAALVESVEDVLAELPPVAQPLEPATRPLRSGAYCAPASSSSAARMARSERDPILDALGHEPVLPDTLAEHLSMPAGELGARLVLLELAGRIERLPDGRVLRPAPVG